MAVCGQIIISSPDTKSNGVFLLDIFHSFEIQKRGHTWYLVYLIPALRRIQDRCRSVSSRSLQSTQRIPDHPRLYRETLSQYIHRYKNVLSTKCMVICYITPNGLSQNNELLKDSFIIRLERSNDSFEENQALKVYSNMVSNS